MVQWKVDRAERAKWKEQKKSPERKTKTTRAREKTGQLLTEMAQLHLVKAYTLMSSLSQEACFDVDDDDNEEEGFDGKTKESTNDEAFEEAEAGGSSSGMSGTVGRPVDDSRLLRCRFETDDDHAVHGDDAEPKSWSL